MRPTFPIAGWMAGVLAFALAACAEDPPHVTPTVVQPGTGWSMSQTLTWEAPGPNVYILTSPDGQKFLVTGQGGICPYAPLPTLPAEKR